ncbi:MAG: hypothetical protein QM328_03255 [Acidobacteriota bacterium]|nr:hypothetical protein [Acidobacteriota bacterium]
MMRVGLLMMMLALVVLPAAAQLPTSVDEFAESLDMWDDPESVALLFLTAVYVYTYADQDLGADLLDLILIDCSLEYDMPILAAALDETPWVFDSYVEGTSPGNGYAGIDPDDFSIDVWSTETITPTALVDSDLALVYLTSTGADQARPLILKDVEGAWRVASATPLVAGVKSADGNPGVDIAGTATPDGVAHMFFEGAYLYSMGIVDEGRYLLETILSPDGHATDIDKLLDVVEEKPINVWAYAQGNSPESGYLDFDPFAFRVNITRSDTIREDLIKYFIDCTGAESTRPFQCHLTRRGQLRMYEFSSLRLDVQPPTVERW